MWWTWKAQSIQNKHTAQLDEHSSLCPVFKHVFSCSVKSASAALWKWATCAQITWTGLVFVQQCTPVFQPTDDQDSSHSNTALTVFWLLTVSVSYDNGHKAVLSASLWTKALEMLPGHIIGNHYPHSTYSTRALSGYGSVMATNSTRCYVSHLYDITKLIVWRGRVRRNGLHVGVSPCPQHKVFNFTFVDTSSNSEVAILAPLGAPRICYQLKHKYIFIHVSISF